MKKMIISLSIVGLLIFVVVCLYEQFSVDVRYACAFAETLYDYDIEKVDEYFNANTRIVYRGREDTYSNCRKNVVTAFEKKEYNFASDSSYGNGNNFFENGVQQILISLYGRYKGESIGECIVIMNLRRECLFKYTIESIECDADVFGHIFFGVV